MPVRGYNETIEVQANTPERDGAGQLVAKWRTVRRVGMKITPVSGQESRRGEQLEATASHTGECRYFAGAAPTMRLKRGGRTFSVLSVLNRGERNRWLDWQLSEVVA